MKTVKSISAALLLGLVLLFQTACGSFGQSESKAQEPKEGPKAAAGFFEVPHDQLAHLRVEPAKRTTWPIAINTTGTVDWDADHTTQAITQVNGPISRILVDTGARVEANEPLL